MEALIIMLILIGLSIGYFVGWILMLINSAKRNKWGWFVLMFIFQILWIFYLIFAYKKARKRRRKKR